MMAHYTPTTTEPCPTADGPDWLVEIRVVQWYNKNHITTAILFNTLRPGPKVDLMVVVVVMVMTPVSIWQSGKSVCNQLGLKLNLLPLPCEWNGTVELIECRKSGGERGEGVVKLSCSQWYSARQLGLLASNTKWKWIGTVLCWPLMDSFQSEEP